MSTITPVKGYVGVDTKGQKIIVAHSANWGEDRGYGVWVHCENYSAGKIVKTWRYSGSNTDAKSIGVKDRVFQTKEEAIEVFNKLNKSS